MSNRAPRAAFGILALVLAGCGGGDAGAEERCAVAIGFSPSSPIVGTEVRASASLLLVDGVATYTWRVVHDGATIAFADGQPDGSQITFATLTPGPYDVTLDVAVAGEFCPQASSTVNVRSSDGNIIDVRLHITPPLGLDVPPVDRSLQIPTGADYDLGPVVLDPGVVLTGTVKSAGVGVPAYVVFSPLAMEGATVEAYAGTSGTFRSRLLNQAHEVVVVPTSAALAPRRLAWTPGQTELVVDAGSAIAGVVRDPAGNGIANAKVQLTIDGVPTTLGTTLGSGAFTVRGVPSAGASIKIAMTPPAASGLPRLEAFGTFDLSQSVVIAYKNTVALRNLAGTQVRRNGNPVPNAQVTLVGALAAIGTVTAGAAADATGFVRVAASSDGNGVLPTAFAIAAPLSAVVTVTAGDLAVAAFDLTAAVPATINAPAMTIRSAEVARGSVVLDRAHLELVPVGALALAGAQTVHLTADDLGRVSVPLADGGRFDAHWSDPAGRAGSEVFADVSAAGWPAVYALPPALQLWGTLSVTGDPNKIIGASVQLLCFGCNGLDRDRPLAEVASDQLGEFTLAVPDRAMP